MISNLRFNLGQLNAYKLMFALDSSIDRRMSNFSWVHRGCFLLRWYICFLPGQSGAEIKCTVQFAPLKRPIIQFQLIQQSRQQALRAFYPIIYIYCSNEKEKKACLASKYVLYKKQANEGLLLLHVKLFQKISNTKPQEKAGLEKKRDDLPLNMA